MSTLILVTAPPSSIFAWHALGLAQALKQKGAPFSVFFYQDGVYVANALNWVQDDQRHLTHAWQALEIPLPVCVSAALQRGITDLDNATRHQLNISNLATEFKLVGLGDLTDALGQAERVIQF
ncbi:sulfurtransferase complex subunit TusD [Acinetobacter rathckeae]|uniref:sulfurtransferase complex subunit TusD n=1 Tax=Acinetobacter rathckeae TaxID=2605272 RepID=UPI0018A279A7|nr:sulfurtransferase complex subunit TusD [Acinetobacter rathckeae]MBF7687251.1 sulfurtransferase complex subunit TusD [Acinetobacter rathckeae]MBF7694396.1 sulfurtransferase complex subunit TusD [Acinetobacter rathckeae]